MLTPKKNVLEDMLNFIIFNSHNSKVPCLNLRQDVQANNISICQLRYDLRKLNHIFKHL